MEFKPNEFFLGLVDFIAILLPGALLTSILLAVDNCQRGWSGLVSGPLFQLAQDDKTVAIFWVGFIFTSFGLGYFLSSIASGLDTLADMIRHELFPYRKSLFSQFIKQKHNKKISTDYEEPTIEIIKGKEVLVVHTNTETIAVEKADFDKFCTDFLGNFFRRFFHFFFELNAKVEIDKNLGVILFLRNNVLPKTEADINAYKWSLIVLEANYPVAAEHVNRTMAASKFFRSLVIVFILVLLFAFAGLLTKSYLSLFLTFLLLVLSFREYIVQRQKSIETAYKGLIALYFLPERFVKTDK